MIGASFLGLNSWEFFSSLRADRMIRAAIGACCFWREIRACWSLHRTTSSSSAAGRESRPTARKSGQRTKSYTQIYTVEGGESRPIARKSGQKTKSYTQIYTIGVSLMLYIIEQVFLYIIYSCLQKNKALISCTLFTTVGYIPTGKTPLCSLKLGKVVNDIQNQN